MKYELARAAADALRALCNQTATIPPRLLETRLERLTVRDLKALQDMAEQATKAMTEPPHYRAAPDYTTRYYLDSRDGEEVWVVRWTEGDDGIKGAWVCSPPETEMDLPSQPEWVEVCELREEAAE